MMNRKCDQCRTLHFREPDRHSPFRQQLQAPPKLVHVLHQTKESWLKSIADGCHFCTLARAQVYRSEVANRVCDAFGAFVLLALTAWPGNENLINPSQVKIQIISKNGNSELRGIEDFSDDYSAVLEEYTSSSLPETFESQRHCPGALQPRSPLFNVQLARLWRDECLDQHPGCRPRGSSTNPPRLPTRLIDVKNLEHPFLQESAAVAKQGTDMQYVALSYCWGQGKKFLTLRDNYESFTTDGIPANDLPRTFKDAVYVANSIGYQYIWIDALCIIQNDAEDLQHELRIMGDIYRYAALTICAQGAASSHSGLFGAPRHPLSLTPCEVELTVAHGSQPQIVLNRTLAGSVVDSDFLTPRGWILQEDILTSRALRFSDQMSWRCMEGFRRETEPALPSSPLDPSRSNVGIFSPTSTHLDPLKFMRGWLYAPEHMIPALPVLECASNQQFTISQPNPFTAWYDMVQIYSDKELSFESDTLRALSGISAIFREISSSTYLAGVWKEDLLTGLCWYVSANDLRSVMFPGSGSSTDTNGEAMSRTTPSWTWASVGKVRVRFAPLAQGNNQRLLPRKPRKDGQEVLDAYCAWDDPINEANLDLEGNEAWGRFPGQLWSLRIRTKVKDMILRRSEMYSAWREERQFARRNPHNGSNSLEPTPAVYPRFPGQLLDVNDDAVVLGEAAVDFDIEVHSGRIKPLRRGQAVHKELVKWGTSSQFIKKSGDSQYVDFRVTCLFLDTYRFHADWHDVCSVVVPGVEGSTSFTRIGLGFLPWKEDHVKDSQSGWEVRDCEIV